MPTIVVTYPMNPGDRAVLVDALAGSAEPVYLADLDDAGRAAALRDATVLLARNTAKELRPHEPALIGKPRLIQFINAGIDFVPLNALPAGIPIAMGTDTGPAGRFQGYFEHMELELMADAGLTPMEILIAATAQPAKTHKLEGVGTLVAGKWADLVVLTRNPLEDIRNTRTIESVWIAGNRVPAK